MGFSNGTIFEVNSGGSDTANGGGFDPAATFATDLSATGATGSSPVVTSSSYSFTSSDKVLFIAPGTNWVSGFYPIVSASAGAATLNAAVGAVVLYGVGNGTSGLNATTGCATTASPTGGHWGVDYSRGTSPRISYTDLVIGATTTQFTSAANPVAPNIIGNLIAITSGTGFTVQWVEVVSVSGATATCDKSLGTAASTGGHGGLGGSFASPGKPFGIGLPQTPTVFIRGGGLSYNMSASANVAGGSINDSFGASIIGYNTTRTRNNIDASRPVINVNANSVTCISAQNGYVNNIDFENTAAFTGTTALQSGGNGSQFSRCRAFNFKSAGFNLAAHNDVFCSIDHCDAESCSQSFIVSNYTNSFVGCVAKNTVGTAFAGATWASCIRCIVWGGTGTVNNGFDLYYTENCTVYQMGGGAGSAFNAPKGATHINGVNYGNAGNGFTYGSGSGQGNVARLINCASGGNAGANYNAFAGDQLQNCVVLTGDPFVAGGSGNFAPNTTAGAGALLRALGYSPDFPSLNTASAPDIGAVQSAGGGGAKGGPRGARKWVPLRPRG